MAVLKSESAAIAGVRVSTVGHDIVLPPRCTRLASAGEPLALDGVYSVNAPGLGGGSGSEKPSGSASATRPDKSSDKMTRRIINSTPSRHLS
jgi:hypothetical protein